MQKERSQYDSPNARRPPLVLKGDELSGKLMPQGSDVGMP